MYLTPKKPQYESKDPLIFCQDVRGYQNLQWPGRFIVHVEEIKSSARDNQRNEMKLSLENHTQWLQMIFESL